MNSNDATVTVPNPYKFANGGSPNIAPTRTYGNYTGGSMPHLAPLVAAGDDSSGGPAYHPADVTQIPSYHPPQHQSMQAPSPSSFHARPGRGAGGPAGAGEVAGEGTAAAAGEEGAAMLGAGEAAGGVEAAGLLGALL